MTEFFVDIHCHATMRTMHTAPLNGSARNYWVENRNDKIDTLLGKLAWRASSGVAKVSQTNFYNCVNGKVRVVFDSLYPIERGFVNFRKLPEKIIGKKGVETLVVTGSGVTVERYHKCRNSDDYFKDLCEQYDFLTEQQGASPCGNYQFKIVNNYQELTQVLNEDNHSIAVIVTIEGGHVFGCGTMTSKKMNLNELEKNLIKNIGEVKQWEHPPFFITFAHHFWNQLCGQAATLPPPTRITCNQKPGLNTGFTNLGWSVLKELLSKDNGKRILIDTRHMSAQSRLEYYNFIQQHNADNPDDNIPIISSHSAVNGFSTLSASNHVPDNMKKKRKTPFCAWSLNISDEEVRVIHDSGGIIGIILDKGRHSGIDVLKSIEKIHNPDEKKQAFLKLILDNIFQYVQAVNKKSAWDVLTLGTDFDGVITHFDFYEDMSKMPDLKMT